VIADANLLPVEAYRFKPDDKEDMFFPVKKTVLRKIYNGGWPLHPHEVEEI